MTTTPIVPWEDVLICEDAPSEETTDAGVLIGEGSNYDQTKKPEKGIVVSVGPYSGKGKLPVDIKPGDLIFYERYTANKIPHKGIQYNFVRFKFIVGVIPA